MHNLKAHHHLVIVSLILFGMVSVWTWGTAVFATSSNTTLEVYVGATDSCPNIPGYQATVPDGMLVDGDGNCYTPPPPPVDMCNNMAGDQEVIPDGYYRDASGNCYLQPATAPVDVCPNIDGTQSSVPDGYVNDSTGNCVKPATDMCSNIDGAQYFVPDGMQRTSNGVCFTPTGATTTPTYIGPTPSQPVEDPWVVPSTPRQPTEVEGQVHLKNIPHVLEAIFIPIINAIPDTVKDALRLVPPVIARSFPYYVFFILGAAAALMTFQSGREILAIRRVNKLLKREQDIAEEKNNFIALASHYLRTPVAHMNEVLGTSVTTHEVTDEMLAPLRNALKNLSLQVEQVLGDVASNTSLHSIPQPSVKKYDLSFLKTFTFWLPVLMALVLVGAANFFLGVVGNVELGTYNMVAQSIAFLAVSSVFYSTIRTRYIRAHEHAHLAKLIQHEEAIDAARNDFLERANATLTHALLGVASQRGILAGLQVETPFTEAYQNFDLLLQKLDLLSSIQAGVVGATEQFNIKASIDDIIRHYQPQLDARRLTIVNNVKSISIAQRRSLFDFVLGSLIDNAIKFSNEGGTITIGSAPHDGTLTVQVTDYGVSIPDGKLSELFKPLPQGASALEFNYEGLGFSLFLDKIIMDYVGGTIGATSTNRTFTTFSVTAKTA